MNIPTVLMLADQMLTSIETFHEKGMLHRDIKPENFAVGKEENNKTVYIIDYGLMKRYRDPKSKIHIPFKSGKRLAGTARYASINTHLGYEQSRRDDLECLGYTFVFISSGELPWQGTRAESRLEKYQLIFNKKRETSIENLCKGLPLQFSKYIRYCRNLDFEDKPDYERLKDSFRNCFYMNRYDRGFEYDWIRLGVDLNGYKRFGNQLNVENNNINLGSSRADCGDAEGIIRSSSRKVKGNRLEEPLNKTSVKPSRMLQCLDEKEILENSPATKLKELSRKNSVSIIQDKTSREEVKKLSISKIEEISNRKRTIQKLVNDFATCMKNVLKKQKTNDNHEVKKERSEKNSCNFSLSDMVEIIGMI